jgi:uncharacterized membrane protein (DUF2068 family)
MYQPYPQGGGMPPEPSRPAPPRPVRTAVYLMYGGAALSAISLIVTVLAFHTIERAIQNATTSSTLTQHQIHSVAVAVVVIAVVENLIAIGLWLLMAWANRTGQNWGRIVATVLFGLNTLFLLFGFARARASISLAFSLLIWLVGGAIIVLLWLRESSQYYAAARSPR